MAFVRNMLDYDNIAIGTKVRDIQTGDIFEITDSHPDMDDAMRGIRGEHVEFQNVNTGAVISFYSRQKVSERFEVIEDET